MTKAELIQTIEGLGQAFYDQAKLLSVQAIRDRSNLDATTQAQAAITVYDQYKNLVPMVAGMIAQLTDEQIAAAMEPPA